MSVPASRAAAGDAKKRTASVSLPHQRRSERGRSGNSGISSMQLQRPIFILGCHKSGTSLVRSLLDGHPELDFVYPGELHYFRVSGCESRYPLGSRFPPPRDLTDFAKQALATLEPSARGTTAFAPFGPHPTLSAFSSARFMSAMLRHPQPADPRDRFIRYLDATALALGCDLGRLRRPARIVEKSVSNIEFAPVLKQFFPDCHFIHVLRNPYANLIAIRRAKRGPDAVGALRPYIQAIRLSFAQAQEHARTLSGFQIVRYEDLLQDPGKTLSEICSRLGIAFASSMLLPTVLGKPWGGNSSSRTDFGSTISRQPLSHWQSRITDIEVDLVNRHLPDAIANMDYRRHHATRHWIFPAANESARAYLANRLCLIARQGGDP
jgi:protein-tyrosine sulfotransferase